MSEILGNINSVESMGLVDGPGIRYVVFMQGCELRCKYCHNPETWDKNGKCEKLSAQQLVKKIERFKNYFGSEGGVTFSGGEPLLQPAFLLDCLKECKAKGLHTALDTAGVGFGEYDEILAYTDLVILDVKSSNEKRYREITGQDMSRFKKFCSDCQRLGKKMWIRQVIVPGINDNNACMDELAAFVAGLQNVEKVELLPYRTIGVHKYRELGLPYRLEGVSEMSAEKCSQLESALHAQIAAIRGEISRK